MAAKSSWFTIQKLKNLINTLIGSPAGADVSTDIAAISTLIGTPNDTDVSTDIAAVQTAVDAQVLYGDGTTQLTIGAFGSDTADNYVRVTSGAGGDNLGSWVQLVASLGADSYLNRVDIIGTAPVTIAFAVEIGTGAGASEVTKVRVGSKSILDTDGALYQNSFYINPPIKIASGTRIAARTTDSAAGSQALDVNIGWQIGL